MDDIDKQLEITEKVIGQKQVLRLLAENGLKYVYLAKDADDSIKTEVHDAAKKCGVECGLVASKDELGKAAGIRVAAACVGLLKTGDA